jgi:hypothetical protein
VVGSSVGRTAARGTGSGRLPFGVVASPLRAEELSLHISASREGQLRVKTGNLSGLSADEVNILTLLARSLVSLV